MNLSANIMAAIEQIGLLDELKAISFPANKADILYENMEIITSFGGVNENGE